jgi:hypothetical protein
MITYTTCKTLTLSNAEQELVELARNESEFPQLPCLLSTLDETFIHLQSCLSSSGEESSYGTANESLVKFVADGSPYIKNSMIQVKRET